MSFWDPTTHASGVKVRCYGFEHWGHAQTNPMSFTIPSWLFQVVTSPLAAWKLVIYAFYLFVVTCNIRNVYCDLASLFVDLCYGC